MPVQYPKSIIRGGNKVLPIMRKKPKSSWFARNSGLTIALVSGATIWVLSVLYLSHSAQQKQSEAKVGRQRSSDQFQQQIKERQSNHNAVFHPIRKQDDLPVLREQEASTIISLDDAEDACSHISKKHRHDCVIDVMSMNDREAADHYVVLLEHQEAGDPQPTLTIKEAEEACANVPKESHDSCTHDVLAMNDAEAADHYILLLTHGKSNPDEQEDAAANGQPKSEVSPKQAAIACANVEDPEECIMDVLAMQDIVYAKAFDPRKDASVPKTKDGKILNPQQYDRKAAEHACDPIHEDDREQCIKDVMSMNGDNAVLDYVGLLKAAEAVSDARKKSANGLSTEDATEVCAILEDDAQKELCTQTVVKISDKAVAKRYVQVLKDIHANEILKSKKVTPKDAAVACANAVEKETCINDVLTTNDVNASAHYDKHGAINGHAHHPQLTTEEARQACEPIIYEEDHDQCVKDVMAMNSPESVRHYVQMLQQAETANDKNTKIITISHREAEDACSHVVESEQDECIHDVMAMNDKDVAAHYVSLLEEGRASHTTFTQEHAEATCRAVAEKDKTRCIKEVMKMSSVSTVQHFLQLLKLEEDDPNATAPAPMTEAQARQACAKIEEKSCVHDVMAMNSKELANNYIEMLKSK